jgi:hypothetical protein
MGTNVTPGYNVINFLTQRIDEHGRTRLDELLDSTFLRQMRGNYSTDLILQYQKWLIF